MSKQRDGIDEELGAWLRAQHVFFVATSALSESGHVNCSPKGGDCFRVLGPSEVAYQDYNGSGAETAAHLRENGRIVLMFCAFTGKPVGRAPARDGHGSDAGRCGLPGDRRPLPAQPWGTRLGAYPRHPRLHLLRLLGAADGPPAGPQHAGQVGGGQRPRGAGRVPPGQERL